MDAAGKAFAEWVDTTNLADAVMNGLGALGLKQSAENAKKVWLNILETDLNETLHYAIEDLKEKTELEKEE